MNRKLFLFAVLAALMLLALPAFAEGKTITVWVTGSDTDAAVLQPVADMWASQTGNTAVVQAVSWSDAYAQSLAAVNAGSGADIIIGGMSWGISLGLQGGVVDLGATFPDDVKTIGDASNPGFFNATTTPDGTVYTLPYNLDTYLMFYRPEAFTAKGLEVPKTWDELAAALDAGIKGGIGWGNASWLSFQNFLYQAGGSWYTADCSAPAIDSEAGATALEFYARLYEDYGFSQEAASTAASFSTGELDFVIDGEWTAGGIDSAYPDLVGKWSAAPVPAGPSGHYTAFIGGKGASIFSFSPNVNEAFDLLKFLGTEEATKAISDGYAAQSTIFVPTKPEFSNLINGNADVSAALASQLQDAAGPPNCPGWEESNADIDLELQSVVFEGADFQDALANMNDILQAGIEEYGGSGS